MVAPCLLNVGFDSASHRAVVVEATAAPVDFEGLRINESAFDKILQKFFVLDEGLNSPDCVPPD